MRIKLLSGVLGAGVALVAASARDARACGGCFHEPTPPNQIGTVVTDHRMIFSVSPQQTTLYDQIEYSGSPSSFAWVLPTHGQVTIGLSADVVFSTLDSATQTTIVAPPQPACPPCNCGPQNASAGFAAGSSSGGSSGGGITVITQQVVGPYETVQLHPNSTSDTAALTSWLSANGYAIPSDIAPIIGAYVTEGFDFLAMRLVPGQGIQSMRPVSVTSMGAGLSLPLRMVAAGTGATVGITLWVVATGRYAPANFQSFTILPSDLVWDWNVGSSNYTTVRSQKEASLSNAAWQIESSIDVNPYTVESTVLNGDPTPYEAVDGGTDAGALAARAQDLNTLFPGGPASVRITRMRADLAHAALANDLVLQASSDQSNLSNIYQVTQSINAPQCPLCGCGGTDFPSSSGSSGSSGSSSGTPFGTGTAGGGGADGGNGNSPPGNESFGCATSSGDAPGDVLLVPLAGLACVAFARAKKRQRKDRGSRN